MSTFFLPKKVETNVVFAADTEYAIYFVLKLSYLEGRGCGGSFSQKSDKTMFVSAHLI